jgi:hypothetical protein
LLYCHIRAIDQQEIVIEENATRVTTKEQRREEGEKKQAEDRRMHIYVMSLKRCHMEREESK